jgi:hypothetical protein
VTLQPLGFRRVVLGRLPGAPMSATALAVEFASLFDVELLGLFIDDLGLRRLAAMPAARAISAFRAGWSRLEPSCMIFSVPNRLKARDDRQGWPPLAVGRAGS